MEKELKTTEAQRMAATKYIKANRVTMSLITTPAVKARIQAAALRTGESMNAYILEAVDRRITREELGI